MMAEEVRVHYQEELEALEQRALEGLDMVVTSLDRTMEATEQADVELAGLVITDDDRIDGRYLEVHQSLIALLATQSPVATDLRLISALLHVLKNVERMGDQCVNVCKLIPLTGNEPPADEDNRWGRLVEYDETEKIFTNPSDQRTEDYVSGKVG